MITITVKLTGLPQTQQALQQVSTLLMVEMDKATRASLFQVTRTAQKDYLSGPRPQKLGVVTNRLRGSLSEGKPGLILNVARQTLQITGTVGTNVKYAAIHEFGGIITTRRSRAKYLTLQAKPVKPITMPKRAFLAPALQDSLPWIQERFQLAAHIVEQKIQQLLK